MGLALLLTKILLALCSYGQGYQELGEKKMLCDIVLKFAPSSREMKAANVGMDGEGMQQAVQMVDKKVNPVATFCDLEGQSPSRTLPWATCLQWDYAGKNLFVGT